MPDSFLILVPLLVLAVVLILGFAGCEFVPGVASSPLTFRATVSTDLTVLPPGVQFRWTEPDGTTGSQDVMMPVSGPSINSYIAAALTVSPPSLLWTLADVNGLHDQSGNAHDGTALGGVTIGSDADGPTGFADATASVFDGTDDGVGSAYDPFVGTAPRTFVGWARWAAGGPAAQYTLFGSSAGDTDRPTLRIAVSNRNVIFLPSGSDGQVINWPAAGGTEAVWFMWTLVADHVNNRAILFIDGVRISAQTLTDPWPAAPGAFQAAVGATNKQPFKGSQALVAVYETALTDTQIATMYQASLGGQNVYEHTIYYADPTDKGSWLGGCAMTVQADAQTAQGDSGDFAFDISDPNLHYVLAFHANGSPTAPPFTVIPDGLSTE